MTRSEASPRTSRTTGSQRLGAAGGKAIGRLRGGPGSDDSTGPTEGTGTAIATPETRAPCSKDSGARLSRIKPNQPIDRTPIGRERLSIQLGKLALHDRGRTDWSAAQWELLFDDYLDEFQNFPAYRVEMAMQWLKRNGKPWFPTIAEIVTAMHESMAEWMAN